MLDSFLLYNVNIMPGNNSDNNKRVASVEHKVKYVQSMDAYVRSEIALTPFPDAGAVALRVFSNY